LIKGFRGWEIQFFDSFLKICDLRFLLMTRRIMFLTRGSFWSNSIKYRQLPKIIFLQWKSKIHKFPVTLLSLNWSLHQLLGKVTQTHFHSFQSAEIWFFHIKKAFVNQILAGFFFTILKTRSNVTSVLWKSTLTNPHSPRLDMHQTQTQTQSV
jgi:hypothetical protein